MARPIDYRSTSQHPADTVYATTVDPEFLRARLAQLGGPGAALLEHTADPHAARYQLRHGLDESQLPPLVRSFLAGDVVIDRTESWKRMADGHYDGEVTVGIPGTPASAAGWMRLTDQDSGGSEFHVHVDVTVKVPLIGAGIEALVGDQLVELLAMETAFTQEYLGRR